MKNDTGSSFLYGAHVRANSIRQHYLRYGGKGEPLVIVPGITSPAATWGFVGERLGRRYVKDLDYYIDAIREAQNGLTDFEVVRRSYPNWTEEQLRTRAEWLHTRDEAAIAASHRGLQDDEIHSDFPEIRTPTLLLIAGKGGVITEEDVNEVRKLMPAIEVEWIRHASHMIPFDDLEALIAVVEPFLAKE